MRPASHECTGVRFRFAARKTREGLQEVAIVAREGTGRPCEGCVGRAYVPSTSGDVRAPRSRKKPIVNLAVARRGPAPRARVAKR
jgi:hypothetical protein